MSVRLRTLVSATLVASGLAAVPLVAAPAQAAVPTGPTAVATAPNGITYAGFAAGGELGRVDATGVALTPLALPFSGPIDGLATDDSGNIWASTGSNAYKLTASGGLLQTIALGSDCPATDTDDPGRYGDLAVSGAKVYVSMRCGTAVRRYSATGTLEATWTPPSRTRGIAVVKQSGYAERVAVALPDAGAVAVLPAAFTAGSAATTVDVHAADGWAEPVPTGIAVDAYSQLAVVDTANNAVTLYDLNAGTPSSYRTLGHPTAPSSTDGSLDAATAIDWYRQDRPTDALDGRLFIADTGNGRVQSWDTGGGTQWVTDTEGGTGNGPGSAPINTELPSVTGNPVVGQVLTCDPGEFAGAPTSFEYGWNRNNSYLPGETAQTYTVKPVDAGKRISCFVRASNDVGTSDYATSANVTAASGPVVPSAPANTSRPIISGVTEVGGALTCGNGSWIGTPAPTFTRVWTRNGTAIAGQTATTYVVTTDDVGQQVGCTVTATNSEGSTIASATPVTPTETAPPSPCPGPAGISINTAAEYTTSTSVSLRIRPPAGATQLLISNDGGFDTAQLRPVDASCTYPWTIESSSGRATKLVYVRFVGGGVDELVTLSDFITYDAAAPVVSAPRIQRLAAKGPRSKVFRVSLKASDRTSGVAKVQYAARRGGTGTTTRYRGSFTTRTPMRYQWVRVYDRAGNATTWKKAVRLKVRRR